MKAKAEEAANEIKRLEAHINTLISFRRFPILR
jgi:hypothetical protein